MHERKRGEKRSTNMNIEMGVPGIMVRMSNGDRTRDLVARAHSVDETFRVGKGGIDTVAEELRDQLHDRELVKVTSLRVVREGTINRRAGNGARRAGGG